MAENAEALREALTEHLPNEGDDLGVLRTYVVVAEWTDPEGSEWITYTAGNLNDESPAPWTLKGMLHHTLDTLDQPDDDG